MRFFLFIILLFLISIKTGVSEASKFCKNIHDFNYPQKNCYEGQTEISREEFCSADQYSNSQLDQRIIEKYCSSKSDVQQLVERETELM